MAKFNNKGFAVIGLVIGLIVVGLVGGGVYYRYQSQNKNNQETPPTSTQTPTPASTEESPEPAAVEPKLPEGTGNWLEYKTKGYVIRFADGWKLVKKESSNESLFTPNNKDLEYTAGQRAVVEEYYVTGPGEFQYGFFMDYSSKGPIAGQKCSEQSEYKGKLAFKTAAGNEVYKRVHVGTRAVRDDELGLARGEKSYLYCVQLKGSAQLGVGYILKTSTMEDHSATIERVLKTVIAL